MSIIALSLLSQGLTSLAQSKNSAQSKNNAPANDQDPTDPQDIIAEIANGGSSGLLKYQEQQIAKQARAQELASLGLTEQQLANLPAQQQATADKAIQNAVQQAIKKALGLDSQGGTSQSGSSQSSSSDASSQAGVSSANGLISSSTLASLLGLQQQAAQQ